MNTRVKSIILEFLESGRRQDWPEVVQRAESLLTATNAAPVVLVVPPEVNADQFRSWILASTSCGALPQTTFTALRTDVRAVVANQLLAFLPADRLIDATEVEVVTQLFFRRPEWSYAIVIPHIERLTNAEDLDLVQQSAWRLLVKSPPSNRPLADLQEHHVYLWSFGEPAQFLSARVQRDKEALTKWLNSPTDSYDALLLEQVKELLVVAEECLRRQRNGAFASNASRTKIKCESGPESRIEAAPDAKTLRHLAKVMETLDELGSRLGKRFDVDSELLVGEIGSEMRTWGRELTCSLELEFAELFKQTKALHVDQAKAVVDRRFRLAAANWAQKVGEMIRSHGRAFESDSQELFHTVDWVSLNEMAAAAGQRKNYPEALLGCLYERTDGINTRGLNFDEIGSPQPAADLFPRNLIRIGLPVMGGVGIGTKIGERVATALHVAMAHKIMSLQVIALISLIAGVLTTTVAALNARNHCNLEECRRFIADAMQRFCSAAISDFQNEARSASIGLRQRLDEQFRALEDTLGRAMQESYQSAARSTDGDPAEQLERLGWKLGEIVKQ
jgi:hypothetical protein